MTRWLCSLLLCSALGCASVSDNTVLPVMGVGKGQRDATPSAKAVTDSTLADATAKVDSVDALAQSLLFMPFKDESKYKGEWDIAAELPRGLADSLNASEFFRTLSLD